MSTVLFHRNFQRFQGGHLKVFHYFEHVRSSPLHDARIRFSGDSVWDASNPWSSLRETVVTAGEDPRADALFLAGMDWQTLEPEQRASSPVPIVNLVQAVRHGRDTDPRHEFLAHPAIRICVSAEIQEALEGVGSVEGPIFTVPIGVDLERLPVGRPAEERDIDCVVLAVKGRSLGRRIADRLKAAGYRVLIVDRPMPRDELLGAMARARVTVHLPRVLEGAYLPALESMAVGALVVCPDCVGNRSFCRDGDTCLVPERSEQAIVESALMALTASADELGPMLASAHEESMGRGLTPERTRFLEILDHVDELWAAR
ncbi:MAG: glycosyltransferase [Solirubrobacteraceae bacterium]